MIVPIILQGDDYSCGPTCLMMVLSYYLDRPLSVDERELIRTRCISRQGTSQTRLVRVARTLGIRVGVRHNTTVETYRKAFYYKRPVIVYCPERDHWMVAVAEENSMIICNDPESPIQMRYAADRLDGTVLVMIAGDL